jgi:hypothetical protein
MTTESEQSKILISKIINVYGGNFADEFIWAWQNLNIPSKIPL